MSIELGISVAALVVSAWSVVLAKRASARQARTQERLLSLENSRERDRKERLQAANLRADLIPTGKAGRTLRIENRGPGHARALRILFDGVPLAESELIADGDASISQLGPGAQLSYYVRTFMGMQDMCTIKLEWTDDSGPERSWVSDLKF